MVTTIKATVLEKTLFTLTDYVMVGRVPKKGMGLRLDLGLMMSVRGEGRWTDSQLPAVIDGRGHRARAGGLRGERQVSQIDVACPCH